MQVDFLKHPEGALLLLGQQEDLHVVLALDKDVPSLLKLEPLKGQVWSLDIIWFQTISITNFLHVYFFEEKKCISYYKSPNLKL